MGNLVISYCGCVRFLQTSLFVTDGDKLPSAPFIGWVSFDGIEYPVNQAFETIEEAYEYLNTTFVNIYNKDGEFLNSGGLMEYTNPEDFQTAEIMIQYGLKNLVCTIGDPDPAPNIAVDIAFDNGDTFTSEELFGFEYVQVKVSGIPLQPVGGPSGFVYLPEDIGNPGNGTIITGSALQDCILEVTFTQIPQS